MQQTRTTLKLNFFIQLLTALIFLVFAVIVLLVVVYYANQHAINEAEAKTSIILNRNLATHTYFTHQLKPAIFDLTQPYLPEDYFDATWMSSTYAVREIDQYFKELETFNDYYYKEVAIDARSPQNEADPFEAEFLLHLNEDPDLAKFSEVKKIDDDNYLVTMIRGEVMEESCLKCHSTSEEAPRGLVDVYGPERSFGREAGDVVSAISIRVPVNTAYENAAVFALRIGSVFIAIMALLFLVQNIVFNRFLFEPLTSIKKQAMSIVDDPHSLGDQIDEPFGEELASLTQAFNIMSTNLKERADNLEAVIEERTQEVKASERKYRELFEYNLNAVALHEIVTDEQGTPIDYIFLEVNPAFETMTSLKKENILNKKVTDVIPGIWESHFIATYGKVALEGNPVSFEDYSELLKRTYNIVAFSPRRGYFATIFEDITVKKNAEEALKKYSDELEDLVKERTEKLLETRQELERAEQLAAIGELVSGIGHELRNPLATISNSVYYLQNTPCDDEKKNEMLVTIREEILRSTKIIDDLLGFTRGFTAIKEKTNLTEIIGKALAQYPPPDNITLESDLLVDLPELYIDAQQISQILNNLISNACQAMPEGGTLTVSVERQNEEVQVVIRDNGSGIAEKDKENIFKPLFTTKRQGIGLGLGLAQKYAQANNGRITFTSQVGKGSTFILHLPLEIESEE